MTKLLNKSLRSFSIYALFVLAASIPAYYYLVDHIWLKELDEHNEIIAMRTAHELNAMRLDDKELKRSIALWNDIQPGTSLRPLQTENWPKDSIFTELRVNPYLKRYEVDRFRGLQRPIKINGQSFLLTIETNMEETEETVIAIAGVTLIFFVILVAGFLIINKRLSKNLWSPFRVALQNLKEFNLNHQKPITFSASEVLEFTELNQALEKLIQHTITVYKGQREFTENASHELQTPLAVIKGKLDILLQDEPVSDRQYQIIEEINSALSKISRTNRNLLMLAKIENHQFEENIEVNLSDLTEQITLEISEHYPIDGRPKMDILPNVTRFANRPLVEVMISNMLSNAIRHNVTLGTVSVMLSKNTLTVSNSGTVSLNKEQLFKRFASGNETGSGLGLAIVKEICVRHNWKANYHFADGRHFFSISFN